MPVTGKKKKELSPEYILSKVSEYEIYRYYLGHEITPGEAMLSPFRKEENPSFTVRLNSVNEWRHKDWTDSEKCGGCIDFVMQLFNEDFYATMKRIDKDFGLGVIGNNQAEREAGLISPTPPNMEKRPLKHFIVKAGRFKKEELDYWAAYHITLEELKDNKVYPVRELFIDHQRYPLPDDELIFGYLFGDKWKIYRPFAKKKKDKFKMNFHPTLISGMEKMKEGGRIALITKAKKDEMVLTKLIPTTCSVQYESEFAMTSEDITFLKESFDEVWVNFDSDETGIKECKYYNQFGFKWINCPKGYCTPEGKPIKDFADLARYHGLETVVNYFKSKNLIQ